MIARMNLRENGKPRNYTRRSSTTNCYFNTGSITLLDRAAGIRFFGAWWCTAAVCTARNIIGYAAVVVCLFAAYLRALAIESNRKTWMECRKNERQCIQPRRRRRWRPALHLVLPRHPGEVIENFFLATSSMEVIEATAVETYLFPAEIRK